MKLTLDFTLYDDKQLLDLLHNFKTVPTIHWQYREPMYTLEEGGFSYEDVVYYFRFVRWVDEELMGKIQQWLKRGNKPYLTTFITQSNEFGVKIDEFELKVDGFTEFTSFLQQHQKKLFNYTLLEISNFTSGILIITTEIPKFIKRRTKEL